MRKTAVILCLFGALNVGLVTYLMLRPAVDDRPQLTSVGWKPLAERTSAQRERFAEAAFALEEFDVQDLDGDPGPVTFPVPEFWREQSILFADVSEEAFVAAIGDASKVEVAEDRDSSYGKELPWKTEKVRLRVVSIDVALTEATDPPAADGDSGDLLMKRRTVSRDTFTSRNGLPAPIADMLSVERFYVDVDNRESLRTKKAFRLNGLTSMNHVSEMPAWLMPKGEFAVGQSWTQTGGLPEDVPAETAATAPRPSAERTLLRVVMFEGRRAAEILSTSRVHEFGLSRMGGQPAGVGVRNDALRERSETTRMFVDLETGEPLWFESRLADDSGDIVVRGCNQRLRDHLIQTEAA